MQKATTALESCGYVIERKGADCPIIKRNGKSISVWITKRPTVSQKREGEGLYICFLNKNKWHLAPHDEVVAWLKTNTKLTKTATWQENKPCDYKPSILFSKFLQRYNLEKTK